MTDSVGGAPLVAKLARRSRPDPVDLPSPGVGLIGCGAISEMHLGAYKRLGLDVRALCSRTLSKARGRSREFFPHAAVFECQAKLLQDASVEIVDIATHPEGRARLVTEALDAGKHVLSQKPFALSLKEGLSLVELAEAHGLSLCVNQNGRWAPHLAAIREAARGGYIGEVREVDIKIAWDHSWTVGTQFDRTPHLVLFDFGIHWFDFVASLLRGDAIETVSAKVSFSDTQASPQPMRASVFMTGPQVKVSISFDGDETEDPRDATTVRGTRGSMASRGPDLQDQVLVLRTGGAEHLVPIQGGWFTTGFEGAMSALIASSRGQGTPLNAARENLVSLQLAFAACHSANLGRPVQVKDVSSFPGASS